MLKWPVRQSRKTSPVTFVDGVWQSLDTSIDYLRRRQVGWLCDWQSTCELEAVPTTIHIGSDDQDDRDTPGSDKWRSTPIPPLILHGTLPSTAAVGGRYDPSWSSVTDDDDDDNNNDGMCLTKCTARGVKEPSNVALRGANSVVLLTLHWTLDIDYLIETLSGILWSP